MDIVFIEQLSVITTIGVYDWEQTIEQKLVFDIEMAWDNRKAAKSDDVADCLSYADIAETVVSHVEGARFALVERGGAAVSTLQLAVGAYQTQQARRSGAGGECWRNH